MNNAPGIVASGMYWARTSSRLSYFDCIVVIHPIDKSNNMQSGIIWHRDSFLAERYGAYGTPVILGPRIDPPRPPLRDITEDTDAIWDDETCQEKAQYVLSLPRCAQDEHEQTLRSWVIKHTNRRWAHECAEKLTLWVRKARAFRRQMFRAKR